MNDKCAVLLIEAPETEKMPPELKDSFGIERSVHIYADLLHGVYKTAKSLESVSMVLSYASSMKHPNLTWLDADDPGFLEVKGGHAPERIKNAMLWAFNAGAQKAVFLSNFSPAVKREWLEEAFEIISDKTVVVGPNPGCRLYLLGVSRNNFKILENASSSIPERFAEEVMENAKKFKVMVHPLPETYIVKDEETLRIWMETKEHGLSLFTKESRIMHFGNEDKKTHRKTHKNNHGER
ncbi:MAG: DUF2064 domain-containing protein [Elusimicrobia bacterium]|nr:DUF2064 domain-containing protein [Elusimicrobiota bacterium]